MRHHPENISLLIADPCNIADRTIRIRLRCDITVLITIPNDHLALLFKLCKGSVIGIISSLAMRDGDFVYMVFEVFHKNILADILLVIIPEQGPWQQVRFA